MSEIQALLTVLVDGQATLYGMIVSLQAELLKGQPPAQEEVEQWENEYKKQTATLVEELCKDQPF